MNKLPDRAQGDFQGGYFWQEELFFGQCDLNLNVRLSTLVEHLVIAASQHSRSFGMTYPALLERDRAFVLTRATFTIHTLPRCFQLLTLNTWVDGMKGPYYQRVTEWRDEENRLMVSARSDWVLIQVSTRTLCKPDMNDSNFTTKSPVELPPCDRIKLGDIHLDQISAHRVVWSEIDGNGHLHCSHYPDIVSNSLPSHLQSRPLSSFSIEFQKEGCLGDIISIAGGEVGPTQYIMTGECDGASSFKASLVFAT